MDLALRARRALIQKHLNHSSTRKIHSSMAKKKKKAAAKRNDARGYGQNSNKPQPSPPPQTSSKSSAASSSSSATAKVTPQVHAGLQELLGTLQEEDSSIHNHITGADGGHDDEAVASASHRFAGKLTSIVQRLEDLKFTEAQVEQVCVGVGYSLTLESALDWLCLNLSTTELPALFTEGSVRDSAGGSTTTSSDGSVGVGGDRLEVIRHHQSSVASSGDTSDLGHHQPDFPPISMESSSDEKDSQQHQGDTHTAEKAEDEDEDAKARKAWLLAQYQYEDDEDEGDDAGDEGNVTADCPIQEGESHKAIAHENVVPAQADAEMNVPESEKTSPSPEEERIQSLESQLEEMEADYKNEANNYMRSKQETKQLGIEIKKLKQQVQGARKKMEREKAKERQAAAKEASSSLPSSNDTEEEEAPMNLFGTADDEGDDEEEYAGSDLFSTTSPSAAATTTVVQSEEASAAANSPEATVSVDYSIPSDWTGSTPTKTLMEWCRKRKLPQPKYTKVPRAQGGGFKLAATLEPKQKANEFAQTEYGFSGDIKEYLAIQALYEAEPTMPLYRVFPPVFRDLWLSWTGEIEREKNEAKQLETQAQRVKVDRLLNLIISTSKNDVNSKQGTISRLGSGQLEEPGSKTQAPRDEEASWDMLGSGDEDRNDHGPTGEGARLKNLFVKRQSTEVYKNMRKIRMELPMYEYRETVLETIRRHPVTILCAETGAGKTTNAPQYILEEALLDGKGDMVNILCTQPRRVAATSVAERVAEELCEKKVGEMVGYSIRMETKRSKHTKLLFCTTGVVLRRLQDDPDLTGVTHCIVDEVHERQQQTDVLLIALRRLLRTSRPDLKVVLMSATLDSKLFCSFFNGAPLVSVPGRTFPVSNYYLEDLLEATGHVIEEDSRYAIRRNRYSEQASLMITTRGGEQRKETVDLVSQTMVDDVSDLYPDFTMPTRRYAHG